MLRWVELGCPVTRGYPTDWPGRRASHLARAFAAASSRVSGFAEGTNSSNKDRVVAAISSTARSKTAALALEGARLPDSLRTYWSAAARISSSEAGGA